MRIAAVSDVHSPRYLKELKQALDIVQHPDVLLLAGDMIEVGRWSEYGQVAQAITERVGDIPIVACYGNDEQGITAQDAQEIVGSRITFLDGEVLVVEVGGESLGLLGVPLFDATREGQRQDMEEVLEGRIDLMASRLRKLRETCEKAIVLMHYCPLSPQAFPPEFIWWLAEAFENDRPDMIVHGHVHYSTNPNLEVDDVAIVNVAFPGIWRLTEITL